MVSSRVPSNNNSRILETCSRDPETETGGLETEKRVHRVHGTLETGLQMMPRSLMAPTKGAGAGRIIFDELSDSESQCAARITRHCAVS